MAKARRVRVSIGFTANAGNYESARMQQEIELDLEEGEKVSEVLAQGKEFLRDRVYKDTVDLVDFMHSKR